MLSNIWNHPKTSVAGVLLCVLTIAGVLSQQGITLGTAGTGTVVALIGALATAFLGLLAKDPGSVSVPTSAKAGLYLVILLGCSLCMMGCPATTAVHKCAVAASDIGTALESAATVNHQMLQAGEESQQEAALVAGYINQAAEANDAFIATIKSLPDSGTQITVPQALTAFSTLQTQISNLDQEGILRLKSTKAQTSFATVMVSIQGALAVIQALIAAASSHLAPHSRLPWSPASLPLLGLVLTPAEIEELISLALAAGSSLATKLESLRGETDPELLSSASAADAAAEQQAQADMGTETSTT